MATPTQAAARLAQQLRRRLADRGEGPLGVVRNGQVAADPGHRHPAEADERDREAVGVDLGSQLHRAVRVGLQPVRGAAEVAAARRRLHLDEPQVAELAGDGAGGGAGDAELAR